jgi:hypothetical protein
MRRASSFMAMPKSISLMRSSSSHHDVFRLQVAVHHAVLVHVVERVADAA